MQHSSGVSLIYNQKEVILVVFKLLNLSVNHDSILRIYKLGVCIFKCNQKTMLFLNMTKLFTIHQSILPVQFITQMTNAIIEPSLQWWVAMVNYAYDTTH